MMPKSSQMDVDQLDHPVDGMLNIALEHLGEGERRAVVLKYYERKTFREIGDVLGIKEEAARKRVTRATEKMRTYFARRGTVLTTGALMSHLYFRIAPPAMPGLLEKVTSCALNSAAGAAVAAGPMSIAAGTMRSLALAKAGMELGENGSIFPRPTPPLLR